MIVLIAAVVVVALLAAGWVVLYRQLGRLRATIEATAGVAEALDRRLQRQAELNHPLIRPAPRRQGREL